MAFPTSPTVGQVYTSQRGFTYVYTADGAWIAKDTSSGSLVDPTASTIKAPKLIGFTASSSYQLYSTSQNTLMTNSISQNNLSGNSVFNGNTLVVGSGEAGLWMASAFAQFTGGYPLAFTSVAIWKNGQQIIIGGENAGSGQSSYAHVFGVIPMNVGDYLQWYAFQQSGQQISTSSQNVAAYLISAK